MNLYPLLMAPCFRHGKETPWGGHMLRDLLLKDAPEDVTGESLEISALPGHESMVANGAHAGKSLTRMIELWGDALTGPTGGEFPLLLKLLDTLEPLSVQVHPGDAYAAEHEGKRGKSEAWIILSAEPGSKIVYGVDTHGEPLDQVVAEGRLEDCLRWRNVLPGDVYYIPDGMLHALGEGIMCYEIQQSSDVTYRFYDWGRVDKDGNPRQLHIQQAVEVCKPGLDLEKREGTTVLCKGGSRRHPLRAVPPEPLRHDAAGERPHAVPDAAEPVRAALGRGGDGAEGLRQRAGARAAGGRGAGGRDEGADVLPARPAEADRGAGLSRGERGGPGGLRNWNGSLDI